MTRKITKPERPAFKAKQAEWNRYFDRMKKWELQASREEAGIPEPKKENPNVYITTLAKSLPKLQAEALLKVAARFGIKTMRRDNIVSQSADKPLTNWENDKWSFFYEKRKDSQLLNVNTDGENTMHAGSNKAWGIGEKRFFMAGTVAFLVTYTYATTGCGFNLKMITITEPVVIVSEDPQKQLTAGESSTVKS